ncbi:MAG: ribulose-phosphate 3-epimerase [Clostridiales bacterium]|nr:ribulose-phosphate 3-epimerase [Clostridiales bacterium]
MAKLAPSILSADFSKLAEQVAMTERARADLLHVDVMDGHFVPNISFGADVMKSLCGRTAMPFDVHLMIEDPDKYAASFMTEATRFITVHWEACRHIDRTLHYIKGLGAGAGVAINPGTPVQLLSEVLGIADLVLVMSVNPGFGGQAFIPSSLDKIRELARQREEHGYTYQIEIDGGVSLDNAAIVKEAGTDILVAGSAVFKADDITQRTQAFKDLLG